MHQFATAQPSESTSACSSTVSIRNIGRDRKRGPRATEAIPVLGSEEVEGATGAHEPERELAGGEHGGADPQPGRAHQPEEEETACHAELATVLDGHCTQSALVHGF